MKQRKTIISYLAITLDHFLFSSIFIIYLVTGLFHHHCTGFGSFL